MIGFFRLPWTGEAINVKTIAHDDMGRMINEIRQPKLKAIRSWLIKKYSMKMQTKIVATTLFISCSIGSFAQDKNTVTLTAADATAKSDADIIAKAGEWAAALNLNDAAKEERVKTAIATHLKRSEERRV